MFLRGRALIYYFYFLCLLKGLKTNNNIPVEVLTEIVLLSVLTKSGYRGGRGLGASAKTVLGRK